MISPGNASCIKNENNSCTIFRILMFAWRVSVTHLVMTSTWLSPPLLAQFQSHFYCALLLQALAFQTVGVLPKHFGEF